MKIKSIGLYVYYIALFVIMVSWTNMSSTPPTMVRLLFLGVLVIPLFLYKSSWTPMVLTLFLTTAQNSFSMSFMPANMLFYVLVLLALIFTRRNNNQHIHTQAVLLVLLLFSVLSNLFAGGELRDTSKRLYYALAIVYLFSWLTKKDDSFSAHLLSYSFILSTLALSALYLIFGDQFGIDGMGLFEREYWIDPNYWGTVVGMGTIACFIELFFNKANSFILNVALLAVALLSIVVLVMNASRGAILCVLVSFALIFVASKTSIWVKVLTVFILLAGLFYMYENGVMDYLLYRLFEEGTFNTGGGRLEIWNAKLAAFLSEGPIQWIIGLGDDAATRLATSKTEFSGGMYSGFHNDYLAFLVRYGIIGLFAILYLLLQPLKEKKNRIIVFSLVAYIAVCCFTLEPLSTGHFPYFAFVFYAYVWSYSPDIT